MSSHVFWFPVAIGVAALALAFRIAGIFGMTVDEVFEYLDEER